MVKDPNRFNVVKSLPEILGAQQVSQSELRAV